MRNERTASRRAGASIRVADAQTRSLVPHERSSGPFAAGTHTPRALLSDRLRPELVPHDGSSGTACAGTPHERSSATACGRLHSRASSNACETAAGAHGAGSALAANSSSRSSTWASATSDRAAGRCVWGTARTGQVVDRAGLPVHAVRWPARCTASRNASCRSSVMSAAGSEQAKPRARSRRTSPSASSTRKTPPNSWKAKSSWASFVGRQPVPSLEFL